MHIFYESNIFSCMYFNFIAIYNSPVPQSNNNNQQQLNLNKKTKRKMQNEIKNRKPKNRLQTDPH